jgi:hypothetical protein
VRGYAASAAEVRKILASQTLATIRTMCRSLNICCKEAVASSTERTVFVVLKILAI